jgi:hypothetical protein
MVKSQVLESSLCSLQSSAATSSAWMPSSPDLWHLPQFSPVLPSPVISIHPVQPVPLFATCHKKCTTIFHNQAIKFHTVQNIKNRIHFFLKSNKTVNGAPHDVVHILYKGILYFQNRIFSQYRHKCLSNYGHKKSMAFHEMISMKLTYPQ